MPPWIFVSPASRGVGLELTRRLVRTTTLPVVATARRGLDEVKSKILEGAGGSVDEGRVTVLEVDVTEEESIAAAAAHCKSTFSPNSTSSTESSPSHLHLAFCLPGILHPEKSPSQIDAARALDTLRINTLGPMLLLKHFSPFLPKKSAPMPLLPESATATTTADSNSPPSHPALPPHATFALMSARVGSISDNTRLGGWYSYRASKAGVTQLARTLDNHLRVSSGDRAMAIAMHPGTVRTELSREFWGSVEEEKLFEADFSAEKLVDVVARLSVAEGRGRCWDWKGEEVPP